MPYTFEIDRASRIVFVRGSGPMDLEESLSTPIDLSADPDFESDFAVVADLRELEYEPKASDVITVARNMIRMRPLYRNRVAVIVARPLAIAAELGAAIASAGGFPVQVFGEVEEAVAWARFGEEDSG